MITFINDGKINKYFGLKGETKPVNPPNASEYTEIDNGGKLYRFDRTNQKWWPQNSGGGEGGGGDDTGPSVVYGSITLTTDWVGDGPYTQVVTISGYDPTANTKVDLLADADAVEQMVQDGVDEIYIVNDNATFTAYAIGGKPSTSMVVPAIFSEVN